MQPTVVTRRAIRGGRYPMGALTALRTLTLMFSHQYLTRSIPALLCHFTSARDQTWLYPLRKSQPCRRSPEVNEQRAWTRRSLYGYSMKCAGGTHVPGR